MVLMKDGIKLNEEENEAERIVSFCFKIVATGFHWSVSYPLFWVRLGKTIYNKGISITEFGKKLFSGHEFFVLLYPQFDD